MKDPARQTRLAATLGWLREPAAGRVAAIAVVVAALMVAAILVAADSA